MEGWRAAASHHPDHSSHGFLLACRPRMGGGRRCPEDRTVRDRCKGADLFVNFPAGEGYGVTDLDPVLPAIVVSVALFPTVLGALRPQYVSFLIG